MGLDSEDLSKRVRLSNAVFRKCSVRAAVVEDVLVHGLKTSGLFQTWAAVFRHVTLRRSTASCPMSLPSATPPVAGNSTARKVLFAERTRKAVV